MVPIGNQVKHLPKTYSEIIAKYCLTLLQRHYWLYGLSFHAVCAKTKMNNKHTMWNNAKIRRMLWLASFGYRIKAKLLLDAKRLSSFIVAEPWAMNKLTCSGTIKDGQNLKCEWYHRMLMIVCSSCRFCFFVQLLCGRPVPNIWFLNPFKHLLIFLPLPRTLIIFIESKALKCLSDIW